MNSADGGCQRWARERRSARRLVGEMAVLDVELDQGFGMLDTKDSG